MLKFYENPTLVAPEIAKLLESDLIVTGQIKEHIKPERLAEILGLSKESLYSEDDQRSIGEVLSDAGYTTEQLLEHVVNHVAKSEILCAIDEA